MGANKNISTLKNRNRPSSTAKAKTKVGTESLLGGATEKPIHVLTGMEKINKVRKGISRNDLEQLKNKTGLDYDTLANIFSVAKATLFNKKGTEKFNSSLSEKIFALADLYSYGYDVFGEKDHFNKWMEDPNKALGGQTPIDLLDTIFGIEEIKNLIGRIEHGVYS